MRCLSRPETVKWREKRAPKRRISLSLRDYVALTKPKIVWLLLLVALASAVIAARAIPPMVTLLWLFLGGTLTSLGSLALNSYLEIDVDAKMKRTRNRPLPGANVR